VTGLSRLLVIEMDEHFSLYMSPICIDPEKPAMPIAHPSYYATYLAKRIGPYSTLGLAEDTWALNEGVIDDGIFLQQTYDIDRERESMFFAALDRLKRGSLVCVFDATDRIQHMFWRYTEQGHPAAAGREGAEHRDAIQKLYQHNDALVGRVIEQLRDGDVLMVISDHGFSSFRRGINLNSWLRREGYLTLKDGADGTANGCATSTGRRRKRLSRAQRHVSESARPRTRRHRRTGCGGVRLKAEIIAKLNGLRDGDQDDIGIRGSSAPRHSTKGRNRQRTGAAHRLQRRIPHVVGLRHRRRSRAGLRRQRQALERRSRHRSAAGSGRVLLQSRDRQRPAVADRHRADSAAPLRNRATELHGRPAARRAGINGSRGWCWRR
jgi:hypothetical protein